jgi:hypothetical protein
MVDTPPSGDEGNLRSAAFLFAMPMMVELAVVVPLAILLPEKTPAALYFTSKYTFAFSLKLSSNLSCPRFNGLTPLVTLTPLLPPGVFP